MTKLLEFDGYGRILITQCRTSTRKEFHIEADLFCGTNLVSGWLILAELEGERAFYAKTVTCLGRCNVICFQRCIIANRIRPDVQSIKALFSLSRPAYVSLATFFDDLHKPLLISIVPAHPARWYVRTIPLACSGMHNGSASRLYRIRGVIIYSRMISCNAKFDVS